MIKLQIGLIVKINNNNKVCSGTKRTSGPKAVETDSYPIQFTPAPFSFRPINLRLPLPTMNNF